MHVLVGSTTCILRHLHPYETHRCPMCFDTVYRTDLRPVEIRAITQPEINNRLEFVLLSRVKGTLNPKKVEDGAAESTPGASHTNRLGCSAVVSTDMLEVCC